MRIIAGKWRSRRLPVADIEGLRPTGDRIRETLFNWLGPGIAGLRVLDLFAGSGALGFEAASRGAGEVVLVERDPRAVEQLRANCELLEAVQVSVWPGDALAFSDPDGKVFDLVFLDPPFSGGQLAQAADFVANSPLVGSESRIYLEWPAREVLSLPETWTWLREKRAGDVRYGLAQVAGDSSA